MFEVFEHVRKRFGAKSSVSLNSQGVFRFNMKCIRDYIQDKCFVNVYIDQQLFRIGFQFVNEAGATSMKLCKAKNGSVILNGKSILDKMDLSLHETMKFDIQQDDNIYYFCLEQDIITNKS